MIPAARLLSEILRQRSVREKICTGFMVNVSQDLSSSRIRVRDPSEVNMEFLCCEASGKSMPNFVELVRQWPSDSALELQCHCIRSILDGDS